jgi:DNA-binding CsgD family transcriptional regulator
VTVELTPREQQTLHMIVAGRTTQDIADGLGISPRTAEKHRASLMAKLEVRSVTELMARALRDGLINPM